VRLLNQQLLGEYGHPARDCGLDLSDRGG
jgi:hypothetical protein